MTHRYLQSIHPNPRSAMEALRETVPHFATWDDVFDVIRRLYP